MTPQQQAAQEAANFVSRVNDAILFPLIALMSGVAFLVFVYGGAEYIMHADNDQARAQGRRHILYGLIGLLVMVSAFGILELAAGTFALDDDLSCVEDPSAPGCASFFNP
jgi:Type IV secretion system pilin